MRLSTRSYEEPKKYQSPFLTDFDRFGSAKTLKEFFCE